MKTIFFLQRTHINTPQYQNSANPNLGNRFSAKPLKDTPIRQNFPQSGIAKPSTYERNIQIAKVAATVIGLATMIFAAYRYISKPISCEDLEDNFSGTVKCRFQDGSMYQGELKNDLLSGQGSYTNLFGRIFSGTFKDDEFIHDGRSIALDELDQCKPEGLTDCVISLRNKGCGSIDPAYSGTVDCSFKDGARYQGSVVKEIFSGNGSYTNPSGHTFSGTFKDDRFIDEGRSITLKELDQCRPENLTDCVISLRNKDCDTIDPDYSGKVDCEYDNGDEYHGPVLKGLFSGNGSYIFNDKTRYNGFFEKDYFSGNGTYTNPSGHTFSGTFKDDRFIDESRSITLAELDRCV